MQCKSYFPGHHSARDHNVDTCSSNWPLYNFSKTLDSRHYYNVFLPPPTPEQPLGYDKEVIKQTMLKHEVVFRDQVNELHRLYRRQRELMDEIKSKELYKHRIQLKTSQSNPISSQISSGYTQKTLHISSLPWVNPACNRPLVSGAENIQPPLSFIEGRSMLAGHDFDQTEGSYKDSKLAESKCKKIQKKMLDLQLPANEYIDSEEGELFEEDKVSDVPSYHLKKISEVLPMTDVKLLQHFGGLNSGYQGVALNPDSVLRRSTGLVDLNEPFQFEEENFPNSVDLPGPVTSHLEILRNDLSGKTNTVFQDLSKETFQISQTRSDLQACSNILDPEQQERGREWLPCNDETGQSGSNLNSFTPGFCPEKLATSSKPLQVEPKKAHELPTSLLLDQSNKRSCNERTNFGVEISEGNLDLSRSYYPKSFAASCVPTSSQLVPQSSISNVESSLGLPCRKSTRELNRNPIAVQALPCFNAPTTLRKSSKSSVGSSGLIGDKIQLSKSLSYSSSSTSASSLQNSFFHGNQLELKTSEACGPSTKFDHLKCINETNSASRHCSTKGPKGSESMDVKCAPDMRILLPECSPVVAISQLDTQIVDGEKKIEDPSWGLPWVSAKPFYDGRPKKEREDSNPMKSGFLQAFSSSIHDLQPKMVDESDCLSNKKILGIPTLDQPRIFSDQFSSHQNLSEDEDIENSEKVGALNIYLVRDPIPESRKQPTADSLVVRTGLDKKHLGYGNHIDLNSCINEDDESSSTLSVPRADLKSAAATDLEAPVSPENEECSPPRGESDENQFGMPFQFSGQGDGDRQEDLVRFAAEAIVTISSSRVQVCLESATCESSEASSGGFLHWFAGIVSSVAGDSENEFSVVLSGKEGSEKLLFDGIDYFEAMTLKLTETKVEEHLCKSNSQKEEEMGGTLLPRQQRKGRMRRGRLWKDFQSEVLPCLASLSRHEVTEDLQTIEGLLEAAGTPRETGLSTKNASRNGWVRGRRRSCISASNMVESTTACLLLKQKSKSSELGFEKRGLSLTGWGKITRRRRGQRFPATNLPLILSQV